LSDRVLEICCDSVESAVAAAAGGADRIELCVNLVADGLTPPVRLMEAVRAEVGAMPVFVLVRCRAGDFVFSEDEVELMCGEIGALREAGADGIVCGALTADSEIDQAATRRFLGAADGLPFTFHKGFDCCEDLEGAMSVLVGLGVDRVLTSAGAKRAVDAIGRLARLAEIGDGGTRVLCGGGVRADGLAELAAIPGVVEFHSAARASVDRPVDRNEVQRMVEVLARVEPLR
jgi:copper homeostasis protein